MDEKNIDKEIERIFGQEDRALIEISLKAIGFEKWACTFLPEEERKYEHCQYVVDPLTGELFRIQWDEEIWVRQIRVGENYRITHVILVDWINLHYVVLKRAWAGEL